MTDAEIVKHINKAFYLESSDLIFIYTNRSGYFTKKSLGLGNLKLKRLPNNLTVRGDLDLSGCTSLMSLPENLVVHRDLYLEGCTSLRVIPKSLKVWGDLYLYGHTLYPFDEGKYNIEGCYEILENSIQFILEEEE